MTTRLDKGPVPERPPLRELLITSLEPTVQPRTTPVPTRRNNVPQPDLEQPLPRGAMPVGYPTSGKP